MVGIGYELFVILRVDTFSGDLVAEAALRSVVVAVCASLQIYPVDRGDFLNDQIGNI